MFQGVTSIQSLTIGNNNNNITDISNNAFKNCSSLSTISIPKSITSVSNTANIFSGTNSTITIKGNNSGTTIPNNLFYGDTSMNIINIDSSITGIGTSTFQNCSNLNSININSNNITMVTNNNAFSGTNSAITITGSSTPTTIPANMFYGDLSLNSIDITSNITDISSNAFYGCSNLNYINMPNANTITTVGSSAFAGVQNVLLNTNIIPPSMFLNDASLNTVYFTNIVTDISSNAFNGCTGLKYINLNNVQMIRSFAFNGCNNLKNVVSYPTSLNLSNNTNVFALVTTTSASIYTNAPTTQYLSAYFTNIISPTKTDPSLNTIPHQYNTQSLYNIVSLYGNTNNISLNNTYQLYGIPQSIQSSALNYVNPSNNTSNLQPGLQYVIYNKSGLPQYIQFYPYCNCNISSGSSGASVNNVFSIANNICTIQPNCVICFIYVGTNDTSSQGYITGYANNLI